MNNFIINKHDLISDYWLQSFFTTLEVSNFPMRKRSVAAEKQLQVVTTRRKIELADIAVSFYHLNSFIQKKNFESLYSFFSVHVWFEILFSFIYLWFKLYLFFKYMAHPIKAYWNYDKRCMSWRMLRYLNSKSLNIFFYYCKLQIISSCIEDISLYLRLVYFFCVNLQQINLLF